MAELACVYDAVPVPRTPQDVISTPAQKRRTNKARAAKPQGRQKPREPQARGKWLTAVVMPSGGLCRVGGARGPLGLLAAVGCPDRLGIITGPRGRREARREDGSGQAWCWVVWCVPGPVP
jgi:hypothetical protein